MTDTIPDPRYVTLDASGNGTIIFRGLRPGIIRQVQKVTVEASATGSGTVAILYRGQLLTTKALALSMTAMGAINMGASEEMIVQFANGTMGGEYKVTAHYVESETPGPDAGLVFREAVGFAAPVDEPVLLLDEYIDVGNGDVFDGPYLDMRAFNSYHLAIELGGGTFNATDVVGLELFHFDKGDQGPSEPNVFADQWYLHADGIGTERMIQDAVRGGWMRVYAEAYPASARYTEMFLRVWGSYRSVPALGVRNSLGYSAQGTNVLYDYRNTFAGAGTNVQNAKLGVGRARARLETNGAANVTMNIEYGSVISGLRDSLILTASGTLEKEIILPTRQARVTLSTTAAVSVLASIIQDRNVQ